MLTSISLLSCQHSGLEPGIQYYLAGLKSANKTTGVVSK